MAKERGFIKLYRKFDSWRWYEEPNTCKVFIHCLMRANHKISFWKKNTIKRGQFITSYSNLAKETNLTFSKVRTALQNLIETGEITRKNNKQNSIITVNNYNKYQKKSEESVDERGYVALHRKIDKESWYNDLNMFRVFIHCMIKAKHIDTNEGDTKVCRGDFITTHECLSEELAMPVEEVEIELEKLTSTGKLACKSNNQYIIITLINPDEYQGDISNIARGRQEQINREEPLAPQAPEDKKNIIKKVFSGMKGKNKSGSETTSQNEAERAKAKTCLKRKSKETGSYNPHTESRVAKSKNKTKTFLTKTEKKEIWEIICKSAENGKITARQLELPDYCKKAVRIMGGVSGMQIFRDMIYGKNDLKLRSQLFKTIEKVLKEEK